MAKRIRSVASCSAALIYVSRTEISCTSPQCRVHDRDRDQIRGDVVLDLLRDFDDLALAAEARQYLDEAVQEGVFLSEVAGLPTHSGRPCGSQALAAAKS
jgi:hypothetical protein